MPCLFCPPQQAAVHPREPETRCGRCGERFADGNFPGPPPGAAPRRPGIGLLTSALRSESFSLSFGVGLLFFGVLMSGVGLVALVSPVGDPPEHQPLYGLLTLALMAAPMLWGAYRLLSRVGQRISIRRALARHGVGAVGLVTMVWPSYETSDGTTEGFLQYRYPTPSGWRESRISNLSFDREPEVGQPVHVLYDAARPEHSLLFLAGRYHS